jgi:hypothetical protein
VYFVLSESKGLQAKQRGNKHPHENRISNEWALHSGNLLCAICVNDFDTRELELRGGYYRVRRILDL